MVREKNLRTIPQPRDALEIGGAAGTRRVTLYHLSKLNSNDGLKLPQYLLAKVLMKVRRRQRNEIFTHLRWGRRILGPSSGCMPFCSR